MKDELAQWQEDTDDPMRQRENVYRLKAEIDACIEEGGEASKAKLDLTYPDYFFTESEERKNVLFLAVDDMKDWVNCLGGLQRGGSGKDFSPHRRQPSAQSVGGFSEIGLSR